MSYLFVKKLKKIFNVINFIIHLILLNNIVLICILLQYWFKKQNLIIWFRNYYLEFIWAFIDHRIYVVFPILLIFTFLIFKWCFFPFFFYWFFLSIILFHIILSLYFYYQNLTLCLSQLIQIIDHIRKYCQIMLCQSYFNTILSCR